MKSPSCIDATMASYQIRERLFFLDQDPSRTMTSEGYCVAVRIQTKLTLLATDSRKKMTYYGWSIRHRNLIAQGQCHLSSEMKTTPSSNVKKKTL